MFLRLLNSLWFPKNNPNIENILKNLEIIDLANSITCRNLYQTNFIHFLSKGRTPSLPCIGTLQNRKYLDRHLLQLNSNL